MVRVVLRLPWWVTLIVFLVVILMRLIGFRTFLAVSSVGLAGPLLILTQPWRWFLSVPTLKLFTVIGVNTPWRSFSVIMCCLVRCRSGREWRQWGCWRGNIRLARVQP